MLTPEQLSLRQQGVSGSEAAALVGLNPWAAPIDIYQAKVDPVKTQALADMENPLIRGILFEEPVIKWYSLITKREVTFPGTLQHPKYERIFATPDGVADLPGVDTRVLEVKNTTWHSRDKWGDPGSGDIDPCYYPQVQFEMAVTGLSKVDVCVYSGTEPAIYHVDFNEDDFEALREIGERFYRDHVIPRKPPPPDASESYGVYLNKMFPKATRGMLEPPLGDSLALDIAQLREVRAKLDDLETQETQLKNSIRLAIGEHAGCESENWKLRLIDVKGRTSYDWKRFCDENHITQEALDPYRKVGASHRKFMLEDK